MSPSISICLLFMSINALCFFSSTHAFTAPKAWKLTSNYQTKQNHRQMPSFVVLTMSNNPQTEVDPMEEATMDTEASRQLEKQKRAQLLREQEVFMQRSTGLYQCSNCDWIYDETKGDVMMIGGQIQPGTTFVDLPSNYRCPVCRASKDSFREKTEEIPGFAVNQNYGFGANTWTAGQKNLAIFGGLGLFFVLFLGGYALS